MGEVNHPYVDETILTLEHQLGEDAPSDSTSSTGASAA